MQANENDPDHAHFVSLLTDCQSALGLYVRGLLPGDRAASDVVQQANARIWEKRNDFEAGTNFKAWVLTIARYEVLNYRKQQARDARLRFSDEMEVTLAQEIAELDDDLLERQEALRKCLSRLSSENRDLLFLRYGSRETLPEFAARMSRSVGGLKVKLHRLRTSLAKCIERRLVATGESV